MYASSDVKRASYWFSLQRLAFRILAGILTHKLPPAFLDVRLSVETLCRTGCAYSSQLGA